MPFGSRGTSRGEGEMRRSFEQLAADEQHELAQEAEEQEANDHILDKFFATKSEKGKDMLRRNGYEYIFDKASKTADGEFWKCPKKPYCPGRIIVQIHWQQGEGGQKFKVGKALNEQHNHASIDPSVRDAQNYLRLAAQAEQPHNTRRAVDMARQQMPTGICAQNAPSSSTMARAYRNYVAKSKKPTKPKQTVKKSIKARKAQANGAEVPAEPVQQGT
uniref:FLYWCH-type domain-containing protein n=1 Tax=Globodera rostochiensis TaxID=31243 RepID=A0A914I4G4_GLORO